MRAASVRVDVYASGVLCMGDQIAGTPTPQLSRIFDPRQPIQLDVTRGEHTLLLTLYSDLQATQIVATSCLSRDLGSDSCLRFSLRALPDGGCTSTADCADGGAALCCDHRCIDPFSDPDNCGSCGTTCDAPHSVKECHAGTCSSECDSGWGHCTGEAAGCETNLAQAGMKLCGAACISASSCCDDADCLFPPGPAGCFVPACAQPGSDCSYPMIPGATLCGGVCCRPDHAQCGSACALTCGTGWADCDGAPDTGCECEGAACCAGGTCQVKHANGVGQSFFDCVATGTYNQTQATEACVAFTGDATKCHQMLCGSSPSVCSDGSTVACNCWMYDWSGSGKVKTNGAGNCACKGNSNTASWD